MMSLLMFLGFFIHNIPSIYHFLWLPYLLVLYFQSFILLSQPCQNWLTLHTPSKLYEERWTCSHRAYQTVFLNLHPVVVTVVITLSLSFLLPQHKEILKKTHWAKAHLKFYFSLAIYISINCPDILGKFYTGLALPCNP